MSGRLPLRPLMWGSMTCRVAPTSCWVRRLRGVKAAAKEVGTGQVKLSLFIDENGLPPLMGIVTRHPFPLLFLQRQGVGSEVMLEQRSIAFDDVNGHQTATFNSRMYRRIGMRGFEPPTPSSRTKFRKSYNLCCALIVAVLNKTFYQTSTKRLILLVARYPINGFCRSLR